MLALPATLKIGWQTGGPNGEKVYLPGRSTPFRYNFMQGYIYRLKLTEISGRPTLNLYPTIEVAPSTPATDAYLTHNQIPVQFTAEDLDQVEGGNFVTKVIYLPDPRYQELAVANVETLVSTRLEPGVDPILEADKRGTILLIVRLGGINLEMDAGGARSRCPSEAAFGRPDQPASGSVPAGRRPAGCPSRQRLGRGASLRRSSRSRPPVPPAATPAGGPPAPAEHDRAPAVPTPGYRCLRLANPNLQSDSRPGQRSTFTITPAGRDFGPRPAGDFAFVGPSIQYQEVTFRSRKPRLRDVFSDSLSHRERPI